MGTRAGFHSGEVHGDRLKASGRYIDDGQYIRAKDFDTTYMQSGSAATAGERAHLINSYKFYGGPGGPTMSGVSFGFVAPASLKADAKCDVNLLWVPESSAVAGDVTWALDYWAWKRITTSGVAVSSDNYAISGSHANARVKVTTTAQTHPAEISGVIQETVMPIPSSDIAANDIVEVKVYRAGLESTDTLSGSIHLTGAVITYE